MANSRHKGIELWLKNNHITEYLIYPDMTVDIFENTRIFDSETKFIPFKIKTIKGDLSIYKNTLTSFKNFPSEVFGSLDISDNIFNSFLYCPSIIHKSFIYQRGKINSFENFPEYVGENLYFNDTKINNLKGFNCTFGKEFIHTYDIENSYPIYELEHFYKIAFKDKISLNINYFTLEQSLKDYRLNDDLEILIPQKINDISSRKRKI